MASQGYDALNKLMMSLIVAYPGLVKDLIVRSKSSAVMNELFMEKNVPYATFYIIIFIFNDNNLILSGLLCHSCMTQVHN